MPTVGGGITIVDGLLTLNNTGGTAAAAQFGTAVAARIVTHGTLGGVANGTAGSAVPAVDGTVGYFGALGSINLGAGTVHTLLAGTPYVGPGKFVELCTHGGYAARWFHRSNLVCDGQVDDNEIAG